MIKPNYAVAFCGRINTCHYKSWIWTCARGHTSRDHCPTSRTVCGRRVANRLVQPRSKRSMFESTRNCTESHPLKSDTLLRHCRVAATLVLAATLFASPYAQSAPPSQQTNSAGGKPNCLDPAMAVTTQCAHMCDDPQYARSPTCRAAICSANPKNPVCKAPPSDRGGPPVK